METKKTVEDVKVEETGAVTQTETQKEEIAEVKAFTQKEVDDLIKDRLSREKKKLPTKDELKEFNDWRESQKTDADKNAEKEQEYNKVQNELLTMKQENLVLKKGIASDEVDYVVFKVSKMEGDFEDNLEDFLKSNPKYLSKEETTTKSDGVPTKKIAMTSESGVMSILKAKHPELYE